MIILSIFYVIPLFQLRMTTIPNVLSMMISLTSSIQTEAKKLFLNLPDREERLDVTGREFGDLVAHCTSPDTSKGFKVTTWGDTSGIQKIGPLGFLVNPESFETKYMDLSDFREPVRILRNSNWVEFSPKGELSVSALYPERQDTLLRYIRGRSPWKTPETFADELSKCHLSLNKEFGNALIDGADLHQAHDYVFHSSLERSEKRNMECMWLVICFSRW